ncbi:MAG: DUF1361 domain-containing protein [Chitinophagales bacterium]
MLQKIRHQYLGHRAEISLLLLISSVFACALELLRIYISHRHNYQYFLWNLFLAWIPFAISLYLPVAHATLRWKWLAYVLLFIWVVLWPNSPYMLTDLLHLKEKQNIPLWYDLGLILSFAWTGLLLGFISLLEIQNFIRWRTNRLVAWIFAVLVILFGGFGIYIGRFVRLNSWDILVNPVQTFTDVSGNFNDPSTRIEMIGMTVLYSLFLFLGYLTIKVIIKIPDRMAL